MWIQQAAPLIRWFADTSIADVPLVGGKNASRGDKSSDAHGLLRPEICNRQ
jgi:phosphoenolpyruvate synthase/pyruvate phosphate dikinase